MKCCLSNLVSTHQTKWPIEFCDPKKSRQAHSIDIQFKSDLLYLVHFTKNCKKWFAINLCSQDHEGSIYFYSCGTYYTLAWYHWYHNYNIGVGFIFENLLNCVIYNSAEDFKKQLK